MEAALPCSTGRGLCGNLIANMARNIVICSDGTGNTANKNRGTNVFKLFETVDLHDPDRPQIAIYDDGVGTSDFKPLKLLGGAFGWGLSRNVRQLYASLTRVYEPGDHLYLFGFSRGAFTVRTLAGLITRIGILDRTLLKSDQALRQRVRQAWRVYRHDNQAWLERLLGLFRRTPTPGDFSHSHCLDLAADLPPAGHGVGRARIRFIGVWDTVSAVGFPVLWVADAISCAIYRFKFPNYRLSPCVEKGAQALAIDDQRKTFHPRLWDESQEGDLAGRIQQVWFAGAHANVGGGYPKQGLSLVSLGWMLRQAEAAAPDDEERLRLLAADRRWIHEHANVCDKLYDSRAGLGVYYRYAPRDIHFQCGHLRHPCAFPPWKLWPNATTTPKIHASVAERILQAPEGYAPGNLPRELELVDTEHTPCRWPTLAEDYRNALPQDHNSLLDGVRGWTRLRQCGGWLFMGESLALLLWSLPDGFTERGIFSTLGYFGSSAFLRNLFGTDAVYLCLYTLLGCTFVLTSWIRHRQQRYFSTFWHRLRLRQVHRRRSTQVVLEQDTSWSRSDT